jgi:hypothetical protein
MTTDLPTAIVALVHHAELNRGDWWEREIRRLISVAQWRMNVAATPADLDAELRDLFDLKILPTTLAAQLDVLVEQKDFMVLPTGEYRLSEAARSRISNRVQRNQLVESLLGVRFKEALTDQGIVPDDDMWPSFLADFMTPLLKELGAGAFEALVGVQDHPFDRARFTTFLARFPETQHAQVVAAVSIFLDPRVDQVRQFILGLLGAYLTTQAASLHEEEIAILNKARGSRPAFTLFLDTNFVFSILGLHEHPANETAAALLEVIAAASGHVDVTMFVLPDTLDEVQETLARIKERLRPLRFSANAMAALRPDQFGGVEAKYIEARSRDMGMSVDTYFDPYIENTTAMLKARGIKIHHAVIDENKDNQRMIDDLLREHQWESKRTLPPARRRRTYEALRHDVGLWHIVRGLRPRRVESPVTAGSWIITLDHRLMHFDRRQKSRMRAISLCLAPETFMQMLQFWISRSPKFDDAVLGSMRAFVCQEFDSETESVTLRIMSALSRYEGVEQMSPESVATLVADSALRGVLRRNENTADDVELVRDAIVRREAETQARLLATENLAAALRDSNEATSREKAALEERLAAVEAEREQLRDESGMLKASLDKATESLEDTATRLDRIESDKRHKANRRQRRRFVSLVASLAGALVIAGVVAGVGHVVAWKPLVFLCAIGLVLCYRLLLIGAHKRAAAFEEAVWLKKVLRPSKKVFAIASLVSGGLAVNLLWRWLQNN